MKRLLEIHPSGVAVCVLHIMLKDLRTSTANSSLT